MLVLVHSLHWFITNARCVFINAISWRTTEPIRTKANDFGIYDGEARNTKFAFILIITHNLSLICIVMTLNAIIIRGEVGLLLYMCATCIVILLSQCKNKSLILATFLMIQVQLKIIRYRKYNNSHIFFTYRTSTLQFEYVLRSYSVDKT